MPKTITSPVDHFAGTVTLTSPLPLLLCAEVERARLGVQNLGEQAVLAELQLAIMPAILAVVAKWELANFPATVTADTFPAQPRGESAKLAVWLWKEINSLYDGETEIPLA